MSIVIEELTYIYAEGLPNQSIALSDISFEVEDGEFVGIIGHTGSGKSTLLQQINGLLKPKSGRVVVGGTDITSDKISMIDIRKKVGLVFQYPEYQLFEETVEKDVAYGPGNLNLSESEIAERVKYSLELVGLDYEEFREKSPFELSGGQKRRVAIAGVIAMKPEVLILDEPTAGLDPHAHRLILDMVEKIHREEGIITILVSHNMNDIAALASKVLVMSEGRLALEGRPEDVFARSEDLRDMGLDIPEATSLVEELKLNWNRAEKMKNEISLTIDEAERNILEAYGIGEM